jgi:hypothetical protein
MTTCYPQMRLVQSDAAISVAMVRREPSERRGREALSESTFETPTMPPQRSGAIAVAFAQARRGR